VTAPVTHGSWVTWVMGQELNGSLGSWVTLSDPFPVLLYKPTPIGLSLTKALCRAIGQRNPYRQNNVMWQRADKGFTV